MTILKACGWSGHSFAASASPRPSTKTGYGTFSRWSLRSLWYQIYGIQIAIACGIRGWRNLGLCLNQFVYSSWITSHNARLGSRSSSLDRDRFDVLNIRYEAYTMARCTDLSLIEICPRPVLFFNQMTRAPTESSFPIERFWRTETNNTVKWCSCVPVDRGVLSSRGTNELSTYRSIATRWHSSFWHVRGNIPYAAHPTSPVVVRGHSGYIPGFPRWNMDLAMSK